MFQALNMLEIPLDRFEVWFLGTVDKLLEDTIQQYQKPNWKFFGHINFYDLQQHLSLCDIGIHPSLEEGLSMVIPQLMSCGVPLIATPSTGGENIISNDVNGFIVPVRSPEAIAEKITLMFNNPTKLSEISNNAISSVNNGFTWDDYGDRYSSFIKNIMND